MAIKRRQSGAEGKFKSDIVNHLRKSEAILAVCFMGVYLTERRSKSSLAGSGLLIKTIIVEVCIYKTID